MTRPAAVPAPTFRAVPVAMLDQITPLILTYNELPNIERTLARLAWAKRIVAIDSGSTDGTLEILRRDPRIAVFVHDFVDFAGQCNFGLSHIESPWVLSLDADYELSDELLDELRTLVPGEATAGYRARFVYCIHGRKLRGTLYPPRTVLYRRERGFYRQEGHGHRVHLEGDVLPLRGVIYHDDRKPLSRWLAAQQRYAADEADYLLDRPCVPGDRWPSGSRPADGLAGADCRAALCALCQRLHARRLARMVLRAAAAARRDIAGARNPRSPLPCDRGSADDSERGPTA